MAGAAAAAATSDDAGPPRARRRGASSGLTHFFRWPPQLLSLLLLLLAAAPAGAQNVWELITENIAKSSQLNTAPGTTLERDVQALIFFFNNTCTAAQSDANDAANPYRGAFAQISQWRQNKGWASIVRAHSSVPVQCKALYMEGGEEFAAKHCFWNIDSFTQNGTNGTSIPLLKYPDPHWSIVVECCEQLNRPTLRITDAVFATTKGVGRAHRPGTQAQVTDSANLFPGRSDLQIADDFDYVSKLDCTLPENICETGMGCPCDPTLHSVHTPDNAVCQAETCPGAGYSADRPIGIRSKHYFNVGLAVGDSGAIVRTFDGGYTWDDVSLVDVPENLKSISLNLRMGAFGYENVYYTLSGDTKGKADGGVDGRDWTLQYLESATANEGTYFGLDGVWLPSTSDAYHEGYAVGEGGTIVRILNAGTTGWDPNDPTNIATDTINMVREFPVNTDGTPGCETAKSINDVFFWNKQLAFFVGDQGYLCRYGFLINAAQSAYGPGQYIEAYDGGSLDFVPRWDLQGSDEQGLNWGMIVGIKEYMFSNFRAVFCLQIDDIDETAWSSPSMDLPGVTYTSHLTCFAVGTRPPDTAGTTSAILRYTSLPIGTETPNLDTGIPTKTFQENVAWTPQDARTSEPLNDVYCVKTRKLEAGSYKFMTTGMTDVNLGITCYAVGDNGVIRFTQNGGVSPWSNRFSGVTENLRKVVIIGLDHQTDAGTGDHAVVIGDNGRVLRTNDGGNKWEKLERVTPEHLVSLQFNAFDDYAYYGANTDLSPYEYSYFSNDQNHGRDMPWANGIATGAVLYNWKSKTSTCGVANNNDGGPNTGFYNCKRPEMSVVLRTNCQSTSTSLHWRCRPECQDRHAKVRVALTGTLANPTEWINYWTTPKLIEQRDSELNRAILSEVPQCDEIWTIGHGTPWHEDTRETRLYQSYAVDEATGTVSTFEDVKAIRPAHEMCMYGWPRHLYRMHEGRRLKQITNVTTAIRTKNEYTFLGRLRYGQDECLALGGTYYAAQANYMEDCVFEFGQLTECPSWEVYGMGHTELSVLEQADTTGLIGTTRIPFVNFSVITDPCLDHWFGITCEGHSTADAFYDALENKTITQIWLYSNNLQGAIPESIAELTSIRSLSLGSNRLTGEIPGTIWANMSEIKYISLAENSLSSQIPVQLGDLSTLEELRLHANFLSGNVPTELGSLGALQSLSLHANSLQGELPSEIGSLSSLQYLWTSTNNFTGALPSQLGQLSHLRYLWFANNSFTSLPEELGELANLRSMDGTNNAIVDRLPYSIGKLAQLRVLRLGKNKIRATIPDALGMCTSLVLLELPHNELVGPVPASFGALEDLTTLDLSHNLLERKLPLSMEGMRALQFLFLQDNNLEGGIPPSIGVLHKLEKLNMANNLLTDPLPDELADCHKLELLDLQNNMITGALPDSIWRLKMLEYLFLTNNMMVGPLPEGIGYLPQVRELRLDMNSIDGTIPMTIGDAKTLQVMRMDVNQLSGSIPSSMGKLRNVQFLDLHQNHLVGSIPPEFRGLQSALKVYLHSNSLGGQIPATIGNLTSLQELKISHNQVSGTIPASLGSVQTLEQLSLDHNSIGGSIPQELGQLSTSLKKLELQDNQLNNLLPTFFSQDVFRAVSINLAANPFWCPLPAWEALNGTASCVHCPDDIYMEDPHRTCSDHGVCKDGVECLCDPKWEGTKCDLLRCNANDLTKPPCNDQPDEASGSTCQNEFVPEPCVLDANGTSNDVAAGMCQNLMDDCSAAYHSCPDKGISVQVDSTGIVIAVEAKHNQVVKAVCICANSWSGNDCTMPPLPPPTIEPWPDPYGAFRGTLPENSAAGFSARSAGGARASMALSAALAALGGAVVLMRR